MSKKFNLFLILLSASLLFTGCNNNKEVEKEDMILAGYIVDIEDNNINVISPVGEFKFDISEAEITSEDELAIDNPVEVYYQDELNKETVINASKVIQHFDGYLIGEITNVNGDEFTILSEGNSYVFKLENPSDVDLSTLDLSLIYDVEFDKKLKSKEVNIAQELHIIEVDNAPVEELELVETFDGVIED